MNKIVKLRKILKSISCRIEQQVQDAILEQERERRGGYVEFVLDPEDIQKWTSSGGWHTVSPAEYVIYRATTDTTGTTGWKTAWEQVG